MLRSQFFANECCVTGLNLSLHRSIKTCRAVSRRFHNVSGCFEAFERLFSIDGACVNMFPLECSKWWRKMQRCCTRDCHGRCEHLLGIWLADAPCLFIGWLWATYTCGPRPYQTWWRGPRTTFLKILRPIFFLVSQHFNQINLTISKRNTNLISWKKKIEHILNTIKIQFRLECAVWVNLSLGTYFFQCSEI